MRLRLAQPGRLTWTIYEADGERPGRAVHEWLRDYSPDLVSAADEGKWIVEELGGLPLQGAFYVGLWSPVKESDPRLWATSNESGAVFQREADGSLTKVPRTPLLRVELAAAPGLK
jgi:hypothetical protein